MSFCPKGVSLTSLKPAISTLATAASAGLIHGPGDLQSPAAKSTIFIVPL